MERRKDSGFMSQIDLDRSLSRRRTSEFKFWLGYGEDLLKKKDYRGVSFGVLACSNQGHSGWTESVDYIFWNPRTRVQKELVSRMKVVIKETVGGLLETIKPGIDDFHHLEHISRQLYRLGKEAPPEMILKNRQLLEQSRQMGAPEFLIGPVSALVILDRLEAENAGNQRVNLD